MADFLSYEDALQKMLSCDASPLGTESVLLGAAAGRILAHEQIAPMAVPPFDNSAMDGYAIAGAQVDADAVYTVSQRITAGDNPEALAPGTAARIFTGAPMPDGADSVVIQENAKVLDGNLYGNKVALKKIDRVGQNVRCAGDDIAASSSILSAGQKLEGRSIGLLATAGIAEVDCYRKLRVALLATGDELREPGQRLAPGQIYNSNRYMLQAELESLGAEVMDLGICPDSAEHTRQMLSHAAQSADAVVTVGGMSVGEEDHVREQANALGRLDFWKVAIKPGKPLGFGRIENAYFFGLPGNPVSSFVTYFLFVKPLLKKLMGMASYENEVSYAQAGFDYENRGSRKEFVRVQLVADTEHDNVLPRAELYRTQSSGVLSSLVFATALAVIPGSASVRNGDRLELFRLD